MIRHFFSLSTSFKCKHLKLVFFLWGVSFFCILSVSGQFPSSLQSGPCRGISITVNALSPYNISSYTELINGVTVQRHMVVEFNVAGNPICSNWSLAVRARDDWKRGNAIFNLSETAIRFNSTIYGPTAAELGVNPNVFPLSRNEILLINQCRKPLDNTTSLFDLRYDLIIYGGNNLSNALNGTYYGLLEFILYDRNYNVISTSTVVPSFSVSHQQQNFSNISLSNKASIVSLGFANAMDFANGVSDTKVDGLRVESLASHQIIVKSSSSRLDAPGISQGIPVSSIFLDVGINDYGQSGVRCYPTALSENPKVIADNPMFNARYQRVLYTLTFSISGNTPAIAKAAPGVYSTSIVFMIVPN